jgi:hypothetical protein
MAAKHKVNVSTQPASHRPSSAERHAAEMTRLSTQQAELKQEAADRRAKRVTKSTVGVATARGV